MEHKKEYLKQWLNCYEAIAIDHKQLIDFTLIHKYLNTIEYITEEKKFNEQCAVIENSISAITLIYSVAIDQDLLKETLKKQMFALITLNNYKEFDFMLNIVENFFNSYAFNYKDFFKEATAKHLIPIIESLLAHKIIPAYDFINRAIENKDLVILELFIKAFPYLINESHLFRHLKPPLITAINVGHLPTVQLLLNYETELYKDFCFENSNDVMAIFPITQAFKVNPVIADCLFEHILQSDELLQNHFASYVHSASITHIDNIINNAALLKKILPMYFQITAVATTHFYKHNTGFFLLIKKLIESAVEYPKQRLMIKTVIDYAMDINFTIVNLDSHFEKKFEPIKLLLKEDNIQEDNPKKQLINNISQIFSLLSSHGPIANVYHILDQFKYTHSNSGAKFIKKITNDILKFYLLNETWPQKAWVNEQLEKKGCSLQKSPTISSVNSNPAAQRFQALVGSALFIKSFKNTDEYWNDDGGDPEDSTNWFADHLKEIIPLLKESQLLLPQWPESRILKVLESFKQTSISQNASPAGIYLPFPNHFIPALFFKENDHWVLTIMCRGFLHPKEGYKGAIDFIIEEDDLEKVVDAIQEHHYSFATKEQVYLFVYSKLLWLINKIEAITKIPCTYTNRLPLKPYKTGTCYASNLKNFIVFMLEKMTDLENNNGWETFINKLKFLNIESVQSFELSLDETLLELRPPIEVAYKLITSLQRWREIALFEPKSATEAMGKKLCIPHVHALTQRRIRYGIKFFEKTPECSENSVQENYSKFCALM